MGKSDLHFVPFDYNDGKLEIVIREKVWHFLECDVTHYRAFVPSYLRYSHALIHFLLSRSVHRCALHVLWTLVPPLPCCCQCIVAFHTLGVLVRLLLVGFKYLPGNIYTSKYLPTLRSNLSTSTKKKIITITPCHHGISVICFWFSPSFIQF